MQVFIGWANVVLARPIYRKGLSWLKLITHIDLQVTTAPKLAQSQSLGLQAKDWGILN